jgi:hypothetical protein
MAMLLLPSPLLSLVVLLLLLPPLPQVLLGSVPACDAPLRHCCEVQLLHGLLSCWPAVVVLLESAGQGW